jgi:hypothetical protein
MRSTIVITLAIGTALLLSSATANAGSITASATAIPDGAPIGHLQPRDPLFAPRSPEEQNMQQQMSTLDAEQQKWDQQFDERLNICRGC